MGGRLGGSGVRSRRLRRRVQVAIGQRTIVVALPLRSASQAGAGAPLLLAISSIGSHEVKKSMQSRNQMRCNSGAATKGWRRLV
jgi:hypothetical protein